MGNSNGRRYGSMPRHYPSPYMNRCEQVSRTACNNDTDTARNQDDQCADMVVAMAYVPWQLLDTIYEPENAFPRGTLFPELDKPLMVGGACRG